EAYRLDPFSPVIATNLGRTLFLSGRREEAMNQYKIAIELKPDFAYAHVKLGIALLSQSLVEEGKREVETAANLSPDFSEAQAALARVYVSSGRMEDAKRILQRLKTRPTSEYVPATWIGVVYDALGDSNQAFEWLGKATKQHSSVFPEYYTEPMFDNLRNDRRFDSLLEAINL